MHSCISTVCPIHFQFTLKGTPECCLGSLLLVLPNLCFCLETQPFLFWVTQLFLAHLGKLTPHFPQVPELDNPEPDTC